MKEGVWDSCVFRQHSQELEGEIRLQARPVPQTRPLPLHALLFLASPSVSPTGMYMAPLRTQRCLRPYTPPSLRGRHGRLHVAAV